MATGRVVKRRWDRLMAIMIPCGTETKEEARARQSWSPGYYKDFNGACDHALCRKPRYKRAKEKRNYKKTLLEERFFDIRIFFRFFEFFVGCS